jgi:glutamate dehydrogenase (NADP+)
MINYASGGKESFKGKKVTISGSGNVAQYAALKAIELGATVVSLSDSKGSFIAEDGISAKLIEEIAALKVARKALAELSTEGHGVKYIEGARPWTHVGKVDIALPCATQNEVSGDEAEALVKAGALFVAEGSNMGCTQEAIGVFEAARSEKKSTGIWYGPGKFFSISIPNTSNSLQARLPTPVVSPSPVSKWPRTALVSAGPAKKSTRSSRAS